MDPFVGEIRMFAGNYAPEGWHFCDGSSLPINGNEALYSLIGTIWGGNGVTTFNLPDLRGRVPVGQGQGTNLTARVLGQTGGASTVQLTLAQMPSHTHGVNASTTVATLANVDNNVGFAASTVPSAGTIAHYVPAASATAVNLAAGTISTVAGGSQPHNNVMPYQALNYIIATLGMYPNRP